MKNIKIKKKKLKRRKEENSRSLYILGKCIGSEGVVEIKNFMSNSHTTFLASRLLLVSRITHSLTHVLHAYLSYQESLMF